MLSSPSSPPSGVLPPTLSHRGDDGALTRQFRPTRFAGAGPDGTVLYAVRRDDGDPVRLCFVRQHAQTDALIERWARYQLLSHPNVASLQHVEHAGDDWCAVLEGVPHRSLHQAIELGLTRDAALGVLRQLAAALEAAHELGLWHGQLTADAVSLDAAGGASLEFSGLATWPDGEPTHLPHWRDADGADDVAALADLARLLCPDAEATPALSWVEAARAPEPERRPGARDVRAILEASSRSATRRGPTVKDARPPPALPPPSGGAQPAGHSDTLVGGATAAAPGSVVGRFLLEHLIGRGGMGSVYRGVDRATGERVAVKLLEPALLDDPELRYRFEKEARVLRQVQSPYVANLIEAEVSDTRAYIALEYVEGSDLAEALEQRCEPLPEPLALRLVADTCRALVEPHRRGIVHRDVKPQNVLLVGSFEQPSGLQVKLCDFGIARARLDPQTAAMTQEGSLLGTPQYMAPEQCRGAAVSPATDVYALGLMLYELLCGRPAFESDDLMDLLRRQMMDPPERLPEAVSDATRALVARALEKAPERRFADASELLAAVEAIRGGPTTRNALALGPTDPLALAPPERSVPARVEFSIDLASSPAALWPYVSDTDRMNQVVGLPAVQVRRESSALGPGHAEVFLQNRVLGLSLSWREHPFEWLEGQRWSVERDFERGVMRWYRVTLELEPLPEGGTRLHYRMDFEPVLRLLAWVVRLEVGVKQKRKLLGIFRRVDALIEDGGIERAPSPLAEPAAVDRALAARVRRRVEGLRERGIDPSILTALERHLTAGSDVDVARLRPRRFARVHGFDERACVEACLEATRAGLLTILWDVICPLCQIPAGFAESLERLASHSECPACELSFPLRFAESVELVFRAAPEIRESEVAAYCIGGPARSPHVAAQVRLGAGEGRVLSLALSNGRHRLRSPALPGVIELEVSDEGGFSRADLVVGSRFRAAGSDAEDPRLGLDAVEPVVHLGSGRQTLGLHNDLDHEVTVRVERTADRGDALTAAQAWAMPRFRALFPEQTLESGRLASLGELSFVVLYVAEHRAMLSRLGDAPALAATLRAFDEMEKVTERHGGHLASSGMHLRVATFERASDGLAAALHAWRRLCKPTTSGDAAARDQTLGGERARVSVTLHRGPAVATTIDDRMAYYGETLAQALDLAADAAANELVLSASALADETERWGELSSQLGAPAALRPAPALGPSGYCVRANGGLGQCRDRAIQDS